MARKTLDDLKRDATAALLKLQMEAIKANEPTLGSKAAKAVVALTE